MDNKSSHIDQLIRDTYAQYEAPYDASHWESLEKELDAMAPSPIKYFSSITTGLVAVSVIFMSMLLFVSDMNTKQAVIENVAVEKIAEGSGEKSANEIRKESDVILAQDSTDSEQELEMSGGDSKTTAQKTVAFTSEETVELSIQKKAGSAAKSTVNTLSEKAETTSKSSESNKAIRTGCTGLTIDFEASEEYGKDAKYLWNFGDGFFSNEANPSHTFKKQGTFDVSLSVTSYTTGQITSNVVQAMIDVVEAPIANMDFDIKSPTSVLLHNKSYRADEVEWFVNGSSKASGPDLYLNRADNTRYEVQLSAINAGGCTDTLSKIIKFSNDRLNLPKHINFGLGHELLPSDYVPNGKIIQFKVFDKDEKLVFASTGNQAWTGSENDDQPTEPGNYTWTMAIEKADEILLVGGDLKVL